MAEELELYSGSTGVNVSQSLSQLHFPQLQYKIVSVTPTVYKTCSCDWGVTPAPFLPSSLRVQHGHVYKRFALGPLLLRHRKQTVLPLK